MNMEPREMPVRSVKAKGRWRLKREATEWRIEHATSARKSRAESRAHSMRGELTVEGGRGVCLGLETVVVVEVREEGEGVVEEEEEEVGAEEEVSARGDWEGGGRRSTVSGLGGA